MARIRFIPYQCPLSTPLYAGGNVIAQRSGFLVALHATDNAVGLGEVAPLPKFGTETLEEAHSALIGLSTANTLPEPPHDVSAISNWLASAGVDAHFTPAVSFALECATASIISRRASIEFPDLLKSGSPRSVECNALISGATDEAIAEQAESAVNQGTRALKVKVGGRAPHLDAAVIRKLRRRYPGVVLRADANGSWDATQAEEFCKEVADIGLDYLEDPVSHVNPYTLKHIRARYGVRFAIDDSVRDDVWRETRMKNRAFQVLIVKPSIMGLWTRSTRLITLARELDMQVVVTSLLETSVGLAYISAFAAASGTQGIAHGVDTAAMLEKDVVQSPLRNRNGHIELPDFFRLAENLLPEYRGALGV